MHALHYVSYHNLHKYSINIIIKVQCFSLIRRRWLRRCRDDLLLKFRFRFVGTVIVPLPPFAWSAVRHLSSWTDIAFFSDFRWWYWIWSTYGVIFIFSIFYAKVCNTYYMYGLGLLKQIKISIFLRHHLNEGRGQYAHVFYLVLGFRHRLQDLKIRLKPI